MLAKRQAAHNRLRNLSTKEKEREKFQKINENSSNFRNFFVKFLNKKMIHMHKTVTNCYLKFDQEEGIFSIPI